MLIKMHRRYWKALEKAEIAFAYMTIVGIVVGVFVLGFTLPIGAEQHPIIRVFHGLPVTIEKGNCNAFD